MSNGGPISNTQIFDVKISGDNNPLFFEFDPFVFDPSVCNPTKYTVSTSDSSINTVSGFSF